MAGMAEGLVWNIRWVSESSHHQDTAEDCHGNHSERAGVWFERIEDDVGMEGE